MIFETKVISNPPRDLVKNIMVENLQRGAEVFFVMQDDKNKKISSIDRFLKYRQELECLGMDDKDQKYINNFSKEISGFSANDIEHLVNGLGKRYPCFSGWVSTTNEPLKLLKSFPAGYGSLDQNSFLYTEAVSLSYQMWNGLVALETRKLDTERSVLHDTNQKNKDWRYYHILVDDNSRHNEINLIMQRLYEQLDKDIALFYETEKVFDDTEQSGSTRVNLATIVKKHFKKMGYQYNQDISQQKITVMDKVTQNGNIIRITADAGGFGILIPYIEIQIIGHEYQSPKMSIVKSGFQIHTKEQMRNLLDKHLPILNLYEDKIVPVFDSQLNNFEEPEYQIATKYGFRKYLMADLD